MSLDLVVCPNTKCDVKDCYHSKPHKKEAICEVNCNLRSYAPCKNVIKVVKIKRNKKQERRFYF